MTSATTPTTVRSFCKINLGLRIGPPRPDGFHALTTLYQTIALHDTVAVTATPAPQTTITLKSNDPRVPTDSRNTVVRILTEALSELHATANVHVHLQKNLPIQGGLGAGSANAAAALLALERELDRQLAPTQRQAIAEHIGSDVPLFLHGGTVLGTDRGQQVTPYPDIPTTHCVVVAPAVGSSTPAAFRAWDAHIAAALTPSAATDRLVELSRIYASAFFPAGSLSETGASGVSGTIDREAQHNPTRSGDLAGNPLPALVRTGIENDFQEVVFQQHPFLRDILHVLTGSGETSAIYCALSGSGSSLFGLYRNQSDAQAAHQRVTARGERAFLTQTLTRPEYWQQIFV